MSENQEKTNFLATGINKALPQRNVTPPHPPLVKRPKDRTVEEDEQPFKLEQNSEEANVQTRKDERQPEIAMTDQAHELPVAATMITEEQIRLVAQMLTNANATTQSSEKAKRRKEDLAELLVTTIANATGGEVIKKQFRKVATSQKSKINQGVFAPEALFTIYNSAAAQMKLAGKKVTLSDLMTRALIAYVPEIMKELEEEDQE